MPFNSNLTTCSEHYTEHNTNRKHRRAKRHGCKPGEVYENGVCMQKIGYRHPHRHHRHHRHYLPSLRYRRPIVYTQPVFTQPVYTHPGITPPPVIRVEAESKDTESSGNMKLYLVLAIVIVSLISIFILLSNRR